MKKYEWEKCSNIPDFPTMKKQTKQQLRKRADTLLQDYTKKNNQYCLVCAEPMYCGHHFVTKAASNALRYYIPNIIPICKHCHCLVHNQPHLVEPKICFLLGKEWYDDLIKVKQEGVKANLFWYQSNVETLEKLLGGEK